MSKQEKEITPGVVVEALPDTLFRVELEGGEVILAYLAGRMKLNRIRVLIGDKVGLEKEPYGGKARIVRRY
ncbi:MAG: translation initiation factor IF-1 [bacterium]